MFAEVKQFILDELEERKNNVNKEIEGMRNSITQQEKELERLNQEFSESKAVAKRYTFFEKYITKRREYKEYNNKVNMHRKLGDEIILLNMSIMDTQREVEENIKNSGIKERENQIENQIERVKSAKCLHELGVHPLKAVEILKEHGVQPVLTKEDMICADIASDYTSKSDLMAVHKTDYIPIRGKINSPKDANVKYEKVVTLKNQDYKLNIASPRDTVHFSMNDEVASHLNGSWDDCKIAVLVPFNDIPNEKIARAATQDTFTRGSVDISEDSWILCPKDQVERVKALNSKANIIGYEGESVKGFSKPFLTQLGYRGEDVGTWSWRDNESVLKFVELTKREGIKVGDHTYTSFYRDEKLLLNIRIAAQLAKTIKDNKIAQTPEEMEQLKKQLIEQNCGFGLILRDLCKGNINKDDYETTSITDNSKQIEAFCVEMKKAGIKIPSVYQGVLVAALKANEQGNPIDSRVTEDVNNYTDATPEEKENCRKFIKNYTHSDSDKAFSDFINSVVGGSIVKEVEKMQKMERDSR